MKQWKRKAAAIFAAATLCGALPAHTLPVQTILSSAVLTAHAVDVLSGYCGDPDVNDGKNVTWKLENGVLTISGTGAMEDYPSIFPGWYDNRDSVSNVVIENGVTSIGEYAFYKCSNLISITIPGSVTSIGNAAFSLCINLTDITIPGSVTSIGDAAFYKCSNLISITIPDSVTSIGMFAFEGCSSLTSVTIPDSVTSIGEYAFRSCSSLESVVLEGKTPPQLDYDVFNDTHNDLKIYVPASAVDAYKEAWSDYANRIVSSTIGTWNCGAQGDNCIAVLTKDGTLTISGTGAMEDYPIEDPGWNDDRDSVTNVVIENGVTSIGEYAFYECSNLISITIPGSVTSIGESAFCYCSSLTDITIPDSVTSIGEYAFQGCISLTDITIPGSVTSIGKYAFFECYSLTDITIPDSVTSIGTWAFAYCSSLTDITIPEGVTSIGEYVFYQCSNLNSVTIPGSVTSIGDSAFYYCSSLTGVTIPGSVTSIGKNAFSRCTSLKSVIMKGETPPSLGGNPFSDTHGDLTIYVPAAAVVAYKTKWTDHANRIQSSTVVAWNCGAQGNNCIATLTVDGTLTISGTGAMEDYPIEYPGWNDDRDSVTNVVIENGVTSIGEYAFYKCSNLISITIPGSVTSIENAAFSLCSSLTDITIPDSVTSIGGYAFYNCSSLTDITIPGSVTSIGESAFYNCSSLTDITIPDSVTSIGTWAFAYCSSLTDVTIPGSVTSIGEYAFQSCSSLKTVVLEGETPPELGEDAFDNTHDDLKIYVPAPSGDAYKNAWSDYADKIVEYTALKEEACYPVKTASANKVRVGFTVNVPKGSVVVDYGLIYYNSGNVIHTEHLTLENVGICGIKKAKYYNANITDLGYGVTAVGYVQIRNADQTVDTYYTGELGGSYEAMTNAAKYVTLTKQENKAIISGSKQKVYVGFDANVPNCYTVSDYGLIYYNSGNVIHTEHLTLENVGICGISKARYWGANITDNGYGVTAVGYVKVKDALGNETVIYSEELGSSYAAITKANAENAVAFTRQENKALVSGGKNKVYVGFNAKISEDYTVKDYGLIYYNSGNVIHTEHLTLENVGICGISKAKYWGANITDIGYGVTAVGFVTVEDSNGCVTTLYTEELGGSFTAISEEAAANAVTLTRQANKAIVSGGKNKVYVGFNATVSSGYTVEDYGLIYYNSGTVITTPYLTLENVGICGISKAKYWGANITDNGYGVVCVGFVTVKDANGCVTTLYTGELGAKFADL